MLFPMRKASTWIVIVSSWALWLGCLYDPVSTGGSSSVTGDDVASSGSYVVEQGSLSGDLPVVGDFDADAYQIDASNTSVTLHAGSRGGDFDGWAMTRLYVDLDEVFASSEMTVLEEQSATGCSGGTHGDWDWDRPTNDVVVTVQPGATEQERLVTFEADYPDGSQSAGEFTVVAR